MFGKKYRKLKTVECNFKRTDRVRAWFIIIEYHDFVENRSNYRYTYYRFLAKTNRYLIEIFTNYLFDSQYLYWTVMQ